MRAPLVIAIAAGALVGGAAACGRTGPGLPLPAEAPPRDAWVGACMDGFDRAAARLGEGRDGDAVGEVLAACRPCGVAWDDVLAVPVPPPAKVVAVYDACAVGCPARARADFFAAISALEPDDSPARAWRALGAACPAALPPAGADGRFASGAWFALAQIGRRLGDARPRLDAALAARVDRARLTFALPPLSQVGTGYALPPGAGRTARATLTVTATSIATGRLATATLGAGGLAADPAGPDGAWPGRELPAAGDELDRALAAALGDGADPVLVIAPAGLPAARVLEVAAHAGGPPRLCVAVAAPGPLGPTAACAGAPLLARGGRLVVDATATRAAALDVHGQVAATAALAGATAADRLRPLAALIARAKLVAIAPGDATVADLAALVAALHDAGATAAAPAPPITWPATLGAVADLAAPLAEPPPPPPPP